MKPERGDLVTHLDDGALGIVLHHVERLNKCIVKFDFSVDDAKQVHGEFDYGIFRLNDDIVHNGFLNIVIKRFNVLIQGIDHGV